MGDNDNLSALAAILAGADKLLLLTDQQGLFTADPRHNPQAELIRDVRGLMTICARWPVTAFPALAPEV